MENKAHALAAGLFVTAIAALLVVMALWLMRDTANTQNYEMVTHEPVTGLQVQAAVRYKGVSVGRVTGITFDPDNRRNVLISLAVDQNAPITASTFATLAFQGVTGLSYVQLDDSGALNTPAQNGPGGIPRIPLQANALGQLTDQVGSLLAKVDKAADGINELLAPDRQLAISTILDNANEATQSANRLIQNLEQTLDTQLGTGGIKLSALMLKTSQAIQSAQATIDQIREAIAPLGQIMQGAKASVERVTGSGGVLDRIDESASTVTQTTLPQIQGLATDAGHTIRQLDRIANTLSDNPQVLLFGHGSIPPGPGEEGFVPPSGAPDRPLPQTP